MPDTLDTSKLYIDGAWVASTGSDTMDVFDSTDGSVIGTIPVGTADDLDKAAKAARAAFDGWAAKTAEERAKYCSRIAEGLGARMDEIATVVTREAGMPKWLSQIVQAGLPDQLLRHRRPARRDLRVRDHRRQQPRGQGAGRRRRLHHAVELPAAPDRRQGRLRHGRGLHRGPQAQRDRPARRLHPRRGDPRGRRSRPACSTWSPAPAPSSARPSRTTPRSTW